MGVMNYKATLMILVLVGSALAGCNGGDADGGGNDEIDSDALQNLFDEHFQDFINNTTITVTNHYYNNTTYVVDDGDYSASSITNIEYNNTTIVDGGEIHNYVTENSNHSYGFGQGVNGTVGSMGPLFMVHLEWDAIDMFPEYGIPGDRNNTFSVNWTYWDYPTGQERTDPFELSCSEYYLFESTSENSSWGTYWESSEPYYDAWDNQYNDTIADILQYVAWYEYFQGLCNDNYVPSGAIVDHNDEFEYNFLNITIPEGFAIAYMQEGFRHHSSIGLTSSYGELWDSYSISEGNWHPRNAGNYVDVTYYYMYGGWEDITVEFNMYVFDWNEYIYPDSRYEYTLYYYLIPVIQDTE